MRAWLVSLSLALSACGFQLRQMTPLPETLRNVRIEVVDPFSPIGQEVGRALQRAGANVDVDVAKRTAVLRIHHDSLVTIPLTVGASARVQEYQVVHRVEFELVDAAGQVLLPRETIERRRDYRFDETQALGAAAEDELVRRELRRETVAMLMRRIMAVQ